MRSRTPKPGDQVVRVRECVEESSHRLETVERVSAVPLSSIAVRRTGDHQLAEGSFDWERFVRDVRNGVLKSLSEAEVLQVCDAAMRALQYGMPTLLKPLPPEERRERPKFKGWIADTDISEAVERQLRTGRSRVAHVLYALSIRGRADRDGRHGWRNAADVLDWLYRPENYPDLQLPVVEPHGVATDVWFPISQAAVPRTLIKKSGQPKAFSLAQFEASIRKVMLGRPQADSASPLVAQWVLWGLSGQVEVHANQLAVNVLDCLRRVDDIAYLRWAAVAKRLGSVTQVRDEALGLLSSPSTRLRFREEARPRRPDPRVA
jgi:transcriptional regulator NrdR family protein